MLNGTFLELARQWKYQGFSEIDIVLLPHTEKYLDVQTFITTVERLLKNDIREAEGYMASTLDFAEVKGAVRYTLGGSNGKREEST